MSESPIRLSIVHRSPLLCDALRRRFEHDVDGIEIAFAESRVDRVPARCHARPPDVAIVDGTLERGVLLGLLRDVADSLPTVRILVAAPFDAGRGEVATAVELAEAGAAGFVAGDAGLDGWSDAVARLARGRSSCSVELAGALARRLAPASPADAGTGCPDPADGDGAAALSRREREVLELVATGMANKEIAHRLRITVSTVKNHVHRILTKLDARSRRDATRVAVRRGLLRAVPAPPERASALFGPADRWSLDPGPS